jgi:nicotinamidase-related amidase
MPSVLLIIDFQAEWRDKGSEYYLGNFNSKVRNAALLVEYLHKMKLPVIFTRYIELGSTTAFAEGTKNAQLMSELKVDPSDRVLTKNKISPFYNTDLEKILKEVKTDELVIGGIMTNLCVRSAVSDAYDRDYKIKVVTDACVSDSNEVDKFTFRDLKKTRPEVEFVKTKNLITAMS